MSERVPPLSDAEILALRQLILDREIMLERNRRAIQHEIEASFDGLTSAD